MFTGVSQGQEEQAGEEDSKATADQPGTSKLVPTAMKIDTELADFRGATAKGLLDDGSMKRWQESSGRELLYGGQGKSMRSEDGGDGQRSWRGDVQYGDEYRNEKEAIWTAFTAARGPAYLH